MVSSRFSIPWYREPTATASLSLHQHPQSYQLLKPKGLPAIIVSTLKGVHPRLACRSPRIHPTTIRTLYGQGVAPRLMVNVCLGVLDHFQASSRFISHHQEDVSVMSQLVGLAKHMWKGIVDREVFNQHLFHKCQKKVAGETRLKVHCGECNAS